MRLKLLSPFAIEGFDLYASRIIQYPRAYERAWDGAQAGAGPRLGKVPGVGEGLVQRCGFMHTTAMTSRVGSRYQSIETHSLPRSLHAIELVVREPADAVVGRIDRCAEGLASFSHRHLAPALERVRSVLRDAAQRESPRTLIRVFDHGVALFETDLRVARDLFGPDRSGAPVGVKPALDALQHLGIAYAERTIDRLSPDVLAQLFAWLRGQGELGSRFLHPLREGGESAAASSAMWVTRSLVFERADGMADKESRRDRELRAEIVAHWLKDVTDADEAAKRCTDNLKAMNTSWLNYFFGEESYRGDYPDDGWREPGGGEGSASEEGTESGEPGGGAGAGAFCPEWEAMLIAQYYYAAFDRLQSKISRILAVSVAGEGKRRVSAVKSKLDGAIRDANMLKVDFEENRKYYARRILSKVDAILDGWGFEGRLRPQIDKRIEDCAGRLDELHSRSIERSSVYTDLILLAIGITGVFEVLLFLSMYGRTMSADPELAIYDRTSAFNIADWIGGSSTDVVLFAGLVFSTGLILLYAYFRTSRSRV